MKNLKNKKGISLIVLILTIIVMIILATAIILSLNNSGIIGKANKAKTASDTASLKEYVNVLQAEWELMSETERTGYADDIAYVNAKLEAEGYNRMLNDDGILLTEGATLAIKAGLEIGDEVTGYNDYLTLKVEETSGNENRYYREKEEDEYGYRACLENGYIDPQQISNKTDFVWRYMGINENGEIQIVADMNDDNIPEMELEWLFSYLFGPTELNTICQKLYSTSKGVGRSMNIEDFNNLLEYTAPGSSYYVIDHPDLNDVSTWYHRIQAL